MAYNIEDFKSGKIGIDFTDWTHKELSRLRDLCKAVNPNREEPRYTFCRYYYCDDGHWYESTHTAHKNIKMWCRATEINN